MKPKDQFKTMQDIRIVHDNLGKGYSSKVSLVEHRLSGNKYALKSVSLTRSTHVNSKKENLSTSSKKLKSKAHFVIRILLVSTLKFVKDR